MKKYAIQLYSVRRALEEDFDATLTKIAEMGYDGVEFCGSYGGYDGKELSKFLNHLGLDAVSAHLSYEQCMDNLDYHLDILKECGCDLIVCPWAKGDTLEEVEKYGEGLLQIAEKCLMKGFQFAYHNHAFELKTKFEDGNALDKYMEIGDPLLLAELDIGWIGFVGENPEDYIRKYAGRVVALHLREIENVDGKDVDVTFDKGPVDIKSAIQTGEKMGVTHFIVEHETEAEDEMKNAQIIINQLKELKL
ncbi:MAG: TIM barrel protein [Clostridia bacterium]|nr:TIM barrel protein [Clostridia bacterium]